MDVFATKDGKVYKVSLKSFVAATAKKSPYYKRVKVDGELVEKAYAVCPGCSNPVHFVNLFNADKKKKAHTRHQRSSIRGLAKYSASAYKNCPYVLKDAKAVKKGTKNSEIKTEVGFFSNVMMSTFGFSEKNAQLLADIYLELKAYDSAISTQTFFAVMAAVCYGDVSVKDVKSGQELGFIKKVFANVAWSAIGRINSISIARRYICTFGFDEPAVENLFEQIKQQHEGLDNPESEFYGKPDFAHLCATAAVILNNDAITKTLGGTLAAMQSGIDSADANAGYIGDVCGTDGIGPSMNNGDYKADLDAVNLGARLKGAPSASLLVVTTSYYEGINVGVINRASEFKSNIGIQVLKNQRDSFYLALRKKLSLTNMGVGSLLDFESPELIAQLHNEISVFDTFINCIEAGAEEWPHD